MIPLPFLLITFHDNDEKIRGEVQRELATGIGSAHTRETKFSEDDGEAFPNKESLVLSPIRTVSTTRDRKISWQAPLTCDKIHDNLAPLPHNGSANVINSLVSR